jgi:membrane-bound lytic murein transglycosylase D
MRKVIYIICVIISILPAMAERRGQFAHAGPVYSDTAIKEDTAVNAAFADPKSEFKDLFQTAITGDGMNAPRLNPMAISFVQNYINKNGKGFADMKDWARPYFSMMDEVLEQHGLPKELKYLAVIESGLKYNAISWTGAVGPWAFMPAAAKQYGLKVSRQNDERLDYYKSTHAAAAFLTDLFARYGDWLLVIAAYNGGPGNVDKAIRKAGGSKDFWTIQHYLPNESMNHVKKFIATHYIFEGAGGVTTVTKNEMKDIVLNNSTLSQDEINGSRIVPISGRYNSQVILKYVDLDGDTFKRYNPGFDAQVATKGTYDLRLPAAKMETFIAKKTDILNECMQVLLNPASNK